MKKKVIILGAILVIALTLIVRVKGSFTYEELTNRNGRIYIEVVSGIVLDKEGNGKQLNALPVSNAEDDIIARIDCNAQSGLNVK